MMFSQKLKSHRILKRLAKALIRLRDAQAGLSLCWSHIPHYWKAYALAQLSMITYDLVA